MDGNIISAAYCGTTYITTRPAWLIDYGMVLKLEGLELPNVYEVDFANNKSEEATRVLGGPDGVVIPNKFFLSDAPQIFAWLYLHAGEDDGYTKIQVTIPLSRRPDITDEQPTPEERSLIEQAIAALNTGVEDAEAWAVGERDGEPVSEGDPTYENSAKYWAEKAKTDAPVTSVNGKAGDIELNLDDIPDGETYARATPAQLAQIGTNADDIADIDKLIPAEASAGNQLADKYFVNNEIQTNSAHFRGAWPNWFAVPTDKTQYPADNGGVKTPSANDYIVVLDASGYPAGQTILSGTWRFSYVGSWEMNGRNGWKNEYQVNETALHTEQIAAINAKIPSQASASNQLADKNLVNTKLMAYRTAADQDAIDSAQDGKINALTNLLNNKQSKITANGILKGNGNGGISAAVAGMDYLPTSALYAYRSANAQDAIDNAQDQNINKNTAAINTMQPAATAADIGKALIVKTVADGKPTSYDYGEAGGGGSALTAGDGIDIANDVISNTQGIEYIVGTQTAATSKWTGASTDETLKVGKIIAYYLPFAGTSTAATLALTMADGTTTREISLQLKPGFSVTTNFPAGSIIILVYDGTYWRVNASYDTDTNTYTTGYCVTNGAVAAKTASCTFGYRGDANYFPCLFRYANTAADATLAITTYAPEAAPIYVNGARTSAGNTFSAGVILFLYYNGAYYCYNDGRFPILVDGAVTSVQEYATGLLVNYRTSAAQDVIDAGKQAKITATGILKGDGAGGVSSAMAGADYITGLEILSYGNSTWADFLAAYTANKVVYCRASSNSNPASGSQTRLAFMAYVNDAANPTNVEFQYYRSVSSHSDSQQGDQVFVYKLDKTAGWTVTTRNTFTAIDAGTGLSKAYSNGKLTLGVNSDYRTAADQDVIDDAQDERIADVEQTTTATTIGPVALATFDASAANMPIKGLTANIGPVQAGSGDPSPDNVRPITGWTGANVTRCGKNFLSPTLESCKELNTSGTWSGNTYTFNDGTFTVLTDDSGAVTGIVMNGTFSNNTTFGLVGGIKLPVGNYILNGCPSGGSANTYRLRLTSSGSNFNDYGSGLAISVNDKNRSYLAQMYCKYGAAYDNVMFMPMLRLSTDSSAYEPYKGNVYNITFPAEAGTVYGGTLDVVNRKLNSYPYYSSYNGETLTGPWVSSMDVYTPGATPTLGAQVVDIGGAATSYDLSDAPEITTFLGENNIWANRGDVTVIYGAYLETVKAYADKVGDSILSAIAPLEMNYTASRAYTVGSFLFVGTKFYKATAAIASGDTITPDTNVTQTTVAEQLMALANV